MIGDYNMIPGEDDENFDVLRSQVDFRFVSSEGFEGRFTHIGRGGRPGNFLDGFGFTDTDESEYVERSFEVAQLHEEMGMSLSDFAKGVSDHLPLVAVFRTDADND